jgi:4-amino-4-deoxy-L-arabinose transferase-like glycosyltransferase
MNGARQFFARLSIFAGVGLVIRLIAVLLPWRREQGVGLTDEAWYHFQANLIADGRVLIHPFEAELLDRSTQTAGHPPLTSFVYSIPSLVGLDSPLAHRIFGVLLGVGVIIAIGYFARELAGQRAGLIAAGLAAVYPVFWIDDTAIGSETTFTLFLVLGLLFGYRFWRQPTVKAALLFAGALSLAGLTRSEGALLIPLVMVPFLLVARVTWARRLRLGIVVGVVAFALVGGWVIRNLLTFEEPTFMASGGGQVVAFGNCDRTYSGQFLGYWHTDCALKHWPPGDESVVDKAFREKGLDYLDAHVGRFPIVALARVGRVFHVFRPFQSIEFDAFYERRGLWPSRLALAMFYVLMLFAVHGVVVMRRRKIPISPLLGILVIVVLTAAGSLGITRYRVELDAVLPVLAAVSIEALLSKRAAKRHELSDPGGPLAEDALVPVAT